MREGYFPDGIPEAPSGDHAKICSLLDDLATGRELLYSGKRPDLARAILENACFGFLNYYLEALMAVEDCGTEKKEAPF